MCLSDGTVIILAMDMEFGGVSSDLLFLADPHNSCGDVWDLSFLSTAHKTEVRTNYDSLGIVFTKHSNVADGHDYGLEFVVRTYNKMGRGPKHGEEIVSHMKKWLYSNKTYPYPTKAQKNKMAEECGLETRQVENWLSNARKRLLKDSNRHTTRNHF